MNNTLIIIAVLFLTGCAHFSGSRPHEIQQIEETTNGNLNGKLVKDGPVHDAQQKLLDAFVKAFAEGDAEGCANLYTADTIYMQAGLPMEKGRNVVLQGYKEFFDSRTNKLIEISEPIEEVISFGDMAVIRGSGKNVEETSTGDRIIKTYKYMILSEKQKDGSWLMKWDIYNFDANY